MMLATNLFFLDPSVEDVPLKHRHESSKWILELNYRMLVVNECGTKVSKFLISVKRQILSQY